MLNSGDRIVGLLVRFDHALGGPALFSAGLQGDFGRNIERPRNNSNVVRFFYPDRRTRAGSPWAGSAPRSQGFSTASGRSAFVGSYDGRHRPGSLRHRNDPHRSVERADVSRPRFHVRAVRRERKVGQSAGSTGGLDVNGRFDLGGPRIQASDTTPPARWPPPPTTSRPKTPGAPTPASTCRRRCRRGQQPAALRRAGAVAGVSTRNPGATSLATVPNPPPRSRDSTAADGGPLSPASRPRRRWPEGSATRTLSDRYFRGPSGRGFITGNPDLEPETSDPVRRRPALLVVRASARRSTSTSTGSRT